MRKIRNFIWIAKEIKRKTNKSIFKILIEHKKDIKNFFKLVYKEPWYINDEGRVFKFIDIKGDYMYKYGICDARFKELLLKEIREKYPNYKVESEELSNEEQSFNQVYKIEFYTGEGE